MVFVLIPGAGGAAWYWSRVEEELRRRGHGAAAVDLPADDDAAGLAEYAEAVVAAAAPFPGAVTLVAQSMGGLTAPLVCARRPVVPDRAGQRDDPVARGDRRRVVGPCPARRRRCARWTCARAATRTPASTRSPTSCTTSPRTPSTSRRPPARAVGHPVRRARGRWTRWPDVPTRVLVGRDDRFFPAAFQRRVAEARLGITPDEMPGGHLVALARPVEVADRLVAYLAGSDAERER